MKIHIRVHNGLLSVKKILEMRYYVDSNKIRYWLAKQTEQKRFI